MTSVLEAGRTLDYVPRLVEANNGYLVRDHVGVDPGLWQTARWWRPGPTLDQGSEGACCGFAAAGEAAASPVRLPNVDNTLARAVYRRAKEIDEWEGVDYDGTSVRAALLVGRERGWWSGFYWSKNLDELRAALELGPVDIGVQWRVNQYATVGPDAEVDISGPLAGWHSLLITGYSPRYGRARAPRFRWLNSWGRGYGRRGAGYIDPAKLGEILFQAGGEAGVVVGRAA